MRFESSQNVSPRDDALKREDDQTLSRAQSFVKGKTRVILSAR
jgi:hypothetical protein